MIPSPIIHNDLIEDESTITIPFVIEPIVIEDVALPTHTLGQ